MEEFTELYRTTTKNELRDKAILLYGFSDQQINQIMDWYREQEKIKKLPVTVFGSITPVSRNKRIKDVIQDLIQGQQ
ncbi:DUF3783 domain-containing protein [Candidatus Woesearchaeota archaeon]|nr:DUF3783 domain-containing protein [Candidatus Woesearchaeota archaeon]